MKVLYTLGAAALFATVSSPAISKDTVNNVRPDESYQGQWYTTAGGCSYSRSQAPGYPPVWILIQNPHHINQPNVNADCPTTL